MLLSCGRSTFMSSEYRNWRCSHFCRQPKRDRYVRQAIAHNMFLGLIYMPESCGENVSIVLASMPKLSYIWRIRESAECCDCRQFHRLVIQQPTRYFLLLVTLQHYKNNRCTCPNDTWHWYPLALVPILPIAIVAILYFKKSPGKIAWR